MIGISHDHNCLISEKGSVSYGITAAVLFAAWRVDASGLSPPSLFFFFFLETGSLLIRVPVYSTILYLEIMDAVEKANAERQRKWCVSCNLLVTVSAFNDL